MDLMAPNSGGAKWEAEEGAGDRKGGTEERYPGSGAQRLRGGAR
jgi:hypothetical protein